MKSLNFEFLRHDWKALASLAGFAEQYAYTDPVTSLSKLRLLGEQIVECIYDKHGLEKPYQASLNDLLNQVGFTDVVPSVVITILHAIRIHGNKAAHSNEGTTQTALWLLKESYKLAQWFYLSYSGGDVSDLKGYVELTFESPIDESKSQLKRQKKEFLQQLAIREARMQELLDELHATRAESQKAQATVEQMREALNDAQHFVSVLNFDEAQTRKTLIDSLLIDAGWKLDDDHVRFEVEVGHQPSESGKGYADYVFYDDSGNPLAVLEAKKTSVNVNQGREQAKCYADGLEIETGIRPIIFYTNGYDIRIWNDKTNEPPRKIYGFYSQDSLEYMHYKNRERLPLGKIVPDHNITNRLYQNEAIMRVLEKFSINKRKALIVQSTGTGKTRVSISICECLLRAKWAKRILFLCDRRELRKQARNVFIQYLPNQPWVYVNQTTHKDKNKRIYLATYPGMMKCFETIDVGFFDLIIADESHRSIYNKYRDLFLYFDCHQIGLTATPVSFINRNTFEIFECENGNPTAYYSYEDAVRDKYLSSFTVKEYTTEFLREGIKYTQMNDEQRRELEEQDPDAERIEYEKNKVDKQVFNRDTNRRIIRNLMENGVKINEGTRLGKTIIFARNHNHAILMQELFDEMYPQFGGKFCRVIDNYDPRAGALIDEFKEPASELTIAISVDMLDTGIDVPEVVNLVFAKPVFSYVKFWQMIGRGTRLCKNLFGDNKDKTEFLIFDHWGNFNFFEVEYKEEKPSESKSLQQRLFEARIGLATVSRETQNIASFDIATELIHQDINDLPSNSIAVREKWQYVKNVENIEFIKQFANATLGVLSQEIAPLMQWRNISGHIPEYEFDLLICLLQIALLKNNGRFEDHKAELLDRIHKLQVNLNPVRAKLEIIERVKANSFWCDVNAKSLEHIRKELRGIMKYVLKEGGISQGPKLIDVTENEAEIQTLERKIQLTGLEMIEYRKRVECILNLLINENEVLKAIKAGKPVTKEQLDELAALVLAQDPTLNLEDLVDYYPVTTEAMAKAIRSIVGMDGEAVKIKFQEFARQHSLNSTQLKFMQMIQNYISRFGSIEIDTLYESPFTALDSDGVSGVFKDETLLNELFNLLNSFETERQED